MAFGLVTAGVPWDVAFSLPEEKLIAFTIIAGELNGGRFDWDGMRWREQK